MNRAGFKHTHYILGVAVINFSINFISNIDIDTEIGETLEKLEILLTPLCCYVYERNRLKRAFPAARRRFLRTLS